jgi:hypothetical protein
MSAGMRRFACSAQTCLDALRALAGSSPRRARMQQQLFVKPTLNFLGNGLPLLRE